jgi:hypothetical protein
MAAWWMLHTLTTYLSKNPTSNKLLSQMVVLNGVSLSGERFSAAKIIVSKRVACF